MRIIVTGMVGSFPVGGVAWDYLQYVMGFERLGFEVWYLEDSGAWIYDPRRQTMVDDGEYATAHLGAMIDYLAPSSADRWHFRSADDEHHGPWATDRLGDVIAEADLLLNVSASCRLRPEYRTARRTALIDTDPGRNHFSVFPRADREARDGGGSHWREHDVFLTYAERFGTPGCLLPDLGVAWSTTRPPVVLDAWTPSGPGNVWTTVMTWSTSEPDHVHDGRRYGSKEAELPTLLPLPGLVPGRFELALGGLEPPRDLCREHGWSVVDSLEVTVDAEAYRTYIEASRGEVSIAKNVYVGTGSGWFSCRSTCYLAAGKPVVLQDTGFSSVLPCGDGLLAFSNTAEAASAIATVEQDYDRHAAAARHLAETHFGSDLVLTDLLHKVGLG